MTIEAHTMDMWRRTVARGQQRVDEQREALELLEHQGHEEALPAARQLLDAMEQDLARDMEALGELERRVNPPTALS